MAAAPDVPLVLFLSRIHPKKGLERFLPVWPKVAAAIPGANLVIAGTGDAKHVQGVEKLISTLGVGNSVTLVGQLNGTEKWQALRDADVFILPSHQVGYCEAITEAMAAGCPVVITRACQFDEVESAGAGIVTPDDSMEGFADAVTAILKNKDGVMGHAGRELVAKNYLWSKITDQIEDLYHRVAPAAAVEDA
jgi:glycosyltransferase involved in cell wall biosynthesis